MPTVSVIIPTYNRKAYVQEAIDSVLAQTYSDYEIIVVDDGSTDGTGEALRARYGDRIRYVWQENGGGPSARNRGVEDSRSSWLLFLDDDDMLAPTALTTLCKTASGRPDLGLVSGRHQYADHDGHPLMAASLQPSAQTLDLATLVLGCPMIPSGTLIRSDWFAEVGGFDRSQDAAQDWDLWLQLSASGCPMLLLPDTVCTYRLHSSAMTANLERQLRGHLRALSKVLARSDLPADLRARRSAAYAQVYAVAAERHYGAGQTAEAKLYASRAAAAAPELVGSGELLEGMLAAGQFPQVTRDPVTYRRDLLRNLPVELSRRGMIRRALARRAAAQLFCEYDSERRPRRMRRLLWVMALKDRSWFVNRGVRSIAVHAFLGRRVAQRARSLVRRLPHRELECPE